jgi:small-conductance mechanosensitive channel
LSLIPALGIVVGVLVVAFLGHATSYLVLRRRVGGGRRAVADSFVRNTRRPNQVLLPLGTAAVAVALVPLPGALRSDLLHGIGIALILAATWLLVRLTYVLEDALLARYRLDAADNLRARQVETQIHVLRRITVVAAAVVALGGVMLTFDQVRVAGAGLLASAGVLGLIIGVGVTPLVNNLVAGLQIAISQPIRLDDVVVVDGYWGRIEEIRLTYVVIRVWDLKRLMVPISYLTQNPFENWTRSNATVLGYVYIEVDYTMPVEALRDHLGEVVRASHDWDGGVWNLQVTNLGHETVQLRALMSSPDSSASWNLQCEVRERALAFLQERYPSALPRVRTEVGWAPGEGEAGRRASGGGRAGPKLPVSGTG